MRRFTFFKVLLLLVICVTIVGFWRGWFTLSTQRSDTFSNKVDVRLSVDPDKANDDAERAATEITDTVKEGARKIGDETRDIGKPDVPTPNQ